MAPGARQQWKVGDLVLTKMKGFPAWPVMVSEPEKWGYSSDRKKLLVYLYGNKHIDSTKEAYAYLSVRERENMAATNVEVPSEPTHAGTALLETATGTIQSLAPISKIHQHLCAFHCYSLDMTRQVEAHHFCSHQNEDMRQCLIFDGREADARLIGVEYIVTESLFLSLPDDEKPLWHSHEYEVKSGVLFMPGLVPGPVQRQDLVKVAKTYGKAIHFWQVDRNDPLPLGMPQLMMALTRDGQLDEGMAKDVQQRFGVDFAEERKNRSYMEGPEHGVHPLANGAGKGWRFELRETHIPPVDSVVRIFV